MSPLFVSLFFYYIASLKGLKLPNHLLLFLAFRVTNCCIAKLFTSSFEADKRTRDFTGHTGKEFQV